MIPEDTPYTKCAECHLFVELEEYGWVHLHRGDEADDELNDSHEATPGDTAPLGWWRTNGPAATRARFTEADAS